MKQFSSIVLSIIFAALFSTITFAQCSRGHETADLSSLKIASEDQKPEQAMSTYDPSKIEVPLDNKKSEISK